MVPRLASDTDVLCWAHGNNHVCQKPGCCCYRICHDPIACPEDFGCNQTGYDPHGLCYRHEDEIFGSSDAVTRHA